MLSEAAPGTSWPIASKQLKAIKVKNSIWSSFFTGAKILIARAIRGDRSFLFSGVLKSLDQHNVPSQFGSKPSEADA